MKPNRNLYLDMYRAMLCIAVLLYHLHLLPGGYLAVCSFFGLSGYLSMRSLWRKEHISLKDYYVGRLKKLYLPLVAVVLITLWIVSLYPDVIWVSMKPETKSVLLGYNNLWQIGANMDYFARHTDSPFMHLWYIAILLQVDLVMPFVVMILKKLKSSRIFLFVASVATMGVFVWFAQNKDVMSTYYHTASRVFSIVIGMYAYLLEVKLLEKGSKLVAGNQKGVYWLMMVVHAALFVSVDASSPYFVYAMLAVSVISAYVLMVSVQITTESSNPLTKLLSWIAENSYEIYLVQYPLIYLCQLQYGEEQVSTQMALVIGGSLLLGYLFHLGLQLKGKQLIPMALCAALCICSCMGGYVYATSEDLTIQMKQLEEELAANEALMEELEEENEQDMAQQDDDWEQALEALNLTEDEIRQQVLNMPINFIGDSVMVGAVNALKNKFSKARVNAKKNRTAWAVEGILNKLKSKKRLAHVVVIHLGTNGNVPEAQRKKIMDMLKGHEVFWVSVTNDKDVHVNATYKKLCEEYPNAHYLDWKSYSKGHKDYFYGDGIHLDFPGRKAYANFMYEKLCEYYLQANQQEKADTILAKEEYERSKLTIFGNELLVNIYGQWKESFPEAKVVSQSDMTYESLKSEIQTRISENTLTNRVVYLWDDSMDISQAQVLELIRMCEGHEVYLVNINHRYDIHADGCVVLDMTYEKGDLMADGKHFNAQGREKLMELLKKNLTLTE